MGCHWWNCAPVCRDRTTVSLLYPTLGEKRSAKHGDCEVSFDTPPLVLRTQSSMRWKGGRRRNKGSRRANSCSQITVQANIVVTCPSGSALLTTPLAALTQKDTRSTRLKRTTFAVRTFALVTCPGSWTARRHQGGAILPPPISAAGYATFVLQKAHSSRSRHVRSRIHSDMPLGSLAGHHQ